MIDEYNEDKVQYIESSFSEGYPLLKELIKKHWKECGMKGGPKSMMVDVYQYKALERMGVLKATALMVGREMKGYCLFSISYHPHHLGVKFATMDLIYVDPDIRGVMGYKFIKHTEEVIKKDYDVKYFQYIMNTNKDTSNMLERMGYSASDVVYTKKL